MCVGLVRSGGASRAPVVGAFLLWIALLLQPSWALAQFAPQPQAPPAPVTTGEREARVRVRPWTVQPSLAAFLSVITQGEGNPPRASLVAVTVEGDVSLHEWLNQQAQAGNYVTSLVPAGSGSSLAVVLAAQPSGKGTYVVITVIGAPDLDGITKRLSLNPGHAFVGIHVLKDSAYLLVLRHE